MSDNSEAMLRENFEDALAEIERLTKELAATQETLARNLFRDNKEFLHLRDAAAAIAERAEHRANQAESERDSALRIVEACRAWLVRDERYVCRCNNGDVCCACSGEIDTLQAILAGRGPVTK